MEYDELEDYYSDYKVRTFNDLRKTTQARIESLLSLGASPARIADALQIDRRGVTGRSKKYKIKLMTRADLQAKYLLEAGLFKVAIRWRRRVNADSNTRDLYFYSVAQYRRYSDFEVKRFIRRYKSLYTKAGQVYYRLGDELPKIQERRIQNYIRETNATMQVVNRIELSEFEKTAVILCRYLKIIIDKLD